MPTHTGCKMQLVFRQKGNGFTKGSKNLISESENKLDFMSWWQQIEALVQAAVGSWMAQCVLVALVLNVWWKKKILSLCKREAQKLLAPPN